MTFLTPTFGSYITHHRKEKKLSQENLAAAIGISTYTVGQWERNFTQPHLTLRQTINLINTLDLTVDQLVSASEGRWENT